MSITSHKKLSYTCAGIDSYTKKSFLRSQTTANGTKHLSPYNTKVIALISVNIVPLWDIYGLGTIFTDIRAITLYYTNLHKSASKITLIFFKFPVFLGMPNFGNISQDGNYRYLPVGIPTTGISQSRQ